MKKAPSPVPPPPKLRWGGRLRGGNSVGWQKKRNFFQKFFRVLSVLFNGALLGKGFRIFIFPETGNPEYPRGLFLCPECPSKRFLKRLYSRGADPLRTGPSPWGESGGRILRHISRITVAPRTFLFVRGERLAAPSSLRIGGVRGGEENVLPQKDLPPRFHTHSPALLGGFAFHERFRNGGFTLNRQSRRKALSVEMPDPQGAGGADEASGAQIGAEIPRFAAIPSHEHGRHHRRQARSEDARELIDERNGGIADRGSKLSEKRLDMVPNTAAYTTPNGRARARQT